VEDYQQVVAGKLDMMAMLGVIAGFVTHEMQRILNGLDRLLARLTRIAIRDKEAEAALAEVKNTREALVGQLDYSTAFIGSVQHTRAALEPVNARASVSLAVRQFKQFANDRGISVEIEIEEGVMTPPLPRALYNGVVLNLFTNALKAAMGGSEAAPEPRVVVKAWNDQKRHVLEVADTGVGIPPRLQKRIWDPLFTTTSAQDYNPLGSGMGLGLTLVKKIVTDVKGKIVLVDPPPGFRTCFRVEFSRKGVS
jgi:signal transduction histidine kinase